MIELMAVIMIIVTVCLTSVILLNKSLDNAKEGNLETTLKEIELATDVYLSENESEQINVNSGETICTKLYILQNNGLIEKDLKDPLTDKAILGTTCVYSCLHSDGYIIHEIEGYREKPYICSES